MESQPILDLFAGNWDTGPERMEVVAFDAEAVPAAAAAQGEAGIEAAATLRIDLPADPKQAIRVLDQKEAEVAAANAALEMIPARLERLAQLALSGQTEAVSFAAAGGAPDLPPEEAEVLALLAEWGTVHPTASVAFSPAETPNTAELPTGGIDWETARAQFENALRSIQQTITHLAWVETRQEGQVVGRTGVGWRGDTGTLWRAGSRQEQRLLHRRSVDSALRLRIGLISAVAIVTQGALKLSVLIATPGGAVLALPAVWRFANQIVAETRRFSKPFVS